MRRYDDPVEVRKGVLSALGAPGGPGKLDGAGGSSQEGPEQFLWRDRLWKVRAVVAHWVETGPWWQSSGVRAVLGTNERDLAAESSPDAGPDADRGADLGAEREVWRVEASRGLTGSRGVFDLEFDWSQGSWRLVRCLD